MGEQGAIQEIEVLLREGRFESRFSCSKRDGGLLIWLLARCAVSSRIERNGSEAILEIDLDVSVFDQTSNMIKYSTSL
jgi:hypothetical protein